jgi:hypothetical protein
MLSTMRSSLMTQGVGQPLINNRIKHRIGAATVRRWSSCVISGVGLCQSCRQGLRIATKGNSNVTSPVACFSITNKALPSLQGKSPSYMPLGHVMEVSHLFLLIAPISYSILEMCCSVLSRWLRCSRWRENKIRRKKRHCIHMCHKTLVISREPGAGSFVDRAGVLWYDLLDT